MTYYSKWVRATVKSPALREGRHQCTLPAQDFEIAQVALQYIRYIQPASHPVRAAVPSAQTGSGLAVNRPQGAEHQGLYYLY